MNDVVVKLAPIAVPRETCSRFEASSKLEWLETNGTGGYAMGTVSGANTRRYHGLLVAALRPPSERLVTLAKLDERVLFDGAALDLATNQYPGVLHPRGFERLVSFRLDPFPMWIFDLGGGLTIEKRLFLVSGEQTVIVQYRASKTCRLEVSPMIAFRDHHALGRASERLELALIESDGAEAKTIRVRPRASEELPELRIVHSGDRLVRDGAWHRSVEYLRELDRGLDFREDLRRLGTIELALDAEVPAFVVATFEKERRYDRARIAELEAEERVARRPAFEDPLTARLALAADQFLVERSDRSPTVIAGYPWFTDWGRDTMIALPGLLLSRGRLRETEGVLRAFLGHMDRGLLPNRFPDHAGEALEYNTVDATLWMFQSVHAYLEAGGDPDFVRREVYPKAKESLAWHLRGTHHGIVVDPADGLLIAGGEGTQLTWMDAKVDGVVATPRHGKPVEINALYYNALCLLAQWARQFGEDAVADEHAERAACVAVAFERQFWNPERGCLYDVLLPALGGGYRGDRRLRPNQLLALSLPFPLLDPAKQRSVLGIVERDLLTHVGLRTLAPGDEDYNPHYRGGPRERDLAYHQGVIWPWLLGPFVRAYLAVHGRAPERLAYCRALFRGLELHLAGEACLGTVSEIFEAEAPFRADGAPAQAWSVAELLSVLTKELAAPVRERFNPRETLRCAV